jgi:hypothetical protein
MKKEYILLCDTETDQHGYVVDFGAVVADLKGNILHSCAVLVRGYYDDPTNHPLFHKVGLEGIFSPSKLALRYANYEKMLDSGQRSLISISGINRWLARVNASYNPVLTAYNLAYDKGKCAISGIDLDQFRRSFCLMAACQMQYGNKRKYREFILQNHFFNIPTKLGNMTYQTKAETMAKFLLGTDYPPEPHTGYEDAVGYELPLLVDIIKKKSLKWCLSEVKSGSWERFVVRNNFKPS